MAENILKGSIKITADGFDQTVTQVNKGMETIGNAMKKQSASVYLARDAVLDLSHATKDLAFVGANNLNMLAGPIGKIEALFFDLKATAGSTQGAFAALGAALKGGGGLLLAADLVTTGVSILAKKLAQASSSAQDLKLDINKLSPAFTEMSSGLTDVAAGFASKEFANVTKLSAVLTDLELPLKQRNEALKEYNKIADKQNQISKDDLDNIGKINTAIDRQIELFTRRSLVLAAQDKMKDLFKVIFETQFKIETFRPAPDNNKTLKNLDDASTAYQNFSKHVQEAKVHVDTLMNGFIDFNTGLTGTQENILEKIVGSPQEANKAIDAVGKAKSQIEQLFHFIQEQVKTGGQFGSVLGSLDQKGKDKNSFSWFGKLLDFDPNSVKLSAKQFKEVFDTALEFAFKEQSSFKGLEDFIQPTQEKTVEVARKWYANFQKGIFQLKPPPLYIEQEIKLIPPPATENTGLLDQYFAGEQAYDLKITPRIDINPETLKRNEAALKLTQTYEKMFKDAGLNFPKIDISKLISFDTKGNPDTKKAEQYLSDLYKQGKDLQTLVASSLTPAFEALFSAIANGGNGIQSFFQMLEKQLEAVIEKLLAELAVAAIISAFSGGTSSVLGVAQSLDPLFKSFGKHAHGLFTVPSGGSGDYYPALLSGGEMIIPSSDAPMLKQFTANIGNIMSAFGKLSNIGSNPVANTGNAIPIPLNVNVSGILRMDGNHMKAVLSKVEQKQGRSFT